MMRKKSEKGLRGGLAINNFIKFAFHAHLIHVCIEALDFWSRVYTTFQNVRKDRVLTSAVPNLYMFTVCVMNNNIANGAPGGFQYSHSFA